jgi:hypothetical protein
MRTKEIHPFPEMMAGPDSHLELTAELPLAPGQTASPEMTKFDSVLQKTIHQSAVIEPNFAEIPKPAVIPFQPNA